MSRPELSQFSYEILGLVGRQGAGPHDLLRMARRGRILDWAGESQYYVEPKRLAKLGYLEARPEPGKTRPRTVYSLTAKGVNAIKEYARTPITLTPVKSEALLRLLLADLAGEDVTRESLLTLRDDIADLRAPAAGERRGGGSPPASPQVPAARQPLPRAARRAPPGARRRGRARAQAGWGSGVRTVNAGTKTCASGPIETA
jgi:DNA-binding PadR family transcriptional regulator